MIHYHLTTAKVVLVATGAAVASGAVALAQPDHTVALATIASVPPTLTAILGFLILYFQNRKTRAEFNGKMSELIQAKENIALRTGWDVGSQHANARAEVVAEKTAAAATELGDARERAATAEGKHAGTIEEQERGIKEQIRVAEAKKDEK